MVQAFFVYDLASFSWKYDLPCFNAVASPGHVLTQNVFSVSLRLEHFNR